MIEVIQGSRRHKVTALYLRESARAEWRAELRILADLCEAAGEVAPESSAVSLPSWRTHGRALRLELEALAAVASGRAWRTLPGGALSMAAPTWPVATSPGLTLEAGHGWVRCSAGALSPLAGSAVSGRNVGVCEYTLADGRLSALLWSDVEEAGTIGRVREGAVRGQSGSRVDVDMLDGTRIGGVPLWLGVPGIAVVVPTGTRILIVDLGDDPRQTVAMLSPGESIEASGLGTAIRIGDVLHLPVGSAGTPAPVPLVFAPGIGIDVGAPGSGKSAVLL